MICAKSTPNHRLPQTAFKLHHWLFPSFGCVSSLPNLMYFLATLMSSMLWSTNSYLFRYYSSKLALQSFFFTKFHWKHFPFKRNVLSRMVMIGLGQTVLRPCCWLSILVIIFVVRMTISRKWFFICTLEQSKIGQCRNCSIIPVAGRWRLTYFV